MPIVVNTEYDNVNSSISYPFEDNATMLDNDNVSLSNDFIVDIVIHAIDRSGVIYVSSIDTSALTLYFSDNAGVFAYAEFDAASVAVDIIEYANYGRKLGVVVFGDGLATVINGRDTRVFTYAATKLAAAAVAKIDQKGVRGFLLPDNTLVTGAVTFDGQNGVQILASSNELRFDIIGGSPSTGDDCYELGEPITCIQVTQLAASQIVASKYTDTVIALSLLGISLDDICEAANVIKRPDDTDVCGTPATPATPPVGSSNTFTVCVGATGSLIIDAISTPAYKNPIRIKVEEGTATTNVLTLPPQADIDTIERTVAEYNNPPVPGDKIVIKILGLGSTKL